MRLFVVALVALAGCGMANPRTEIVFNPVARTVRFHDSKDNDIRVDEMTFDAGTKSFSAKGLEIRNNASDPRMANVAQMMAAAEQMKASAEWLRILAPVIQQGLSLLGAPAPSAPPTTSAPSTGHNP